MHSPNSELFRKLEVFQRQCEQAQEPAGYTEQARGFIRSIELALRLGDTSKDDRAELESYKANIEAMMRFSATPRRNATFH